jgi:acid phosphatase family membrane protein YuiD
MYDAAGVRRETGEQAKILNKILVDLTEGHTDEMPKQLKELVGHTPLQVFAGAVLGIAIAIAAKFIVYGTL